MWTHKQCAFRKILESAKPALYLEPGARLAGEGFARCIVPLVSFSGVKLLLAVPLPVTGGPGLND